MSPRRILIVDQDREAVGNLRDYLEQSDFTVIAAHDGESALELARVTRPDLIILDLVLPGLDGNDVCRLLYEESNVPIIVLSALSSETDKLRRLEMGADDYVTNPYSQPELLARVHAVLRRTADKIDRNTECVNYGPLAVSVRRQEVLVNGQPVALTHGEFCILAALVSDPGRAFSRRELLFAAFGRAFKGQERNVDVHVGKIRRKLGFGTGGPIKAIAGFGYRFENGGNVT